MEKIYICLVFIILALLGRSAFAETWLDPDTWEELPSPHQRYSAVQEYSARQDSCPRPEPCARPKPCPPQDPCPVCDIPKISSSENDTAAMYYRKLVGLLFNKIAFKEISKSEVHQRTIVFTITASQFTILETSPDLNVLNEVVIAAFEKAKFNDEAKQMKESYWIPLLWNNGKFVFKMLFMTSEGLFAMAVCAFATAIWLLHKRLKKNLIIVAICSLLIYGYFHTYIECNRRLATDNYIQFIRDNESEEFTFMGKVKNFFKSSEREQKIQKIIDKSKINMPFCRPDEVVLMYFSEMVFKQLQLIVEKMVQSMNTVKDTIPYPFNYFGMMAMPFVFMSLLPFLFRDILNPVSWAKIFKGNWKHETTGNQQGDRLSGENLTLFLKTVSNMSDSEAIVKQPAINGVNCVNGVTYAPEALTAKLDENLNNSNGSKKLEAIEEKSSTLSDSEQDGKAKLKKKKLNISHESVVSKLDKDSSVSLKNAKSDDSLSDGDWACDCDIDCGCDAKSDYFHLIKHENRPGSPNKTLRESPTPL